MKQPKKCLLLVLMFVMLLLGGCKYNYIEPESTAASSDTAPTQPEPVVSCQYLPKKVDNPDNLPVLKWVCLTVRNYGGGMRTWNEAAALELNQILADKGMPFRVQFALLTMDQWLLDSDWFSRPEAQKELADADLIYGQMRAGDMQKYLHPITEYINGSNEISLKNAVPHKYNWLRGTVDNEVYGIPTTVYQSNAGGWKMNSDFLEKYDLTEGDFSGNFWEMDNLFEEIYKKNNEEPFLDINGDSMITSSNAFTGEMDSCYPRAVYDIMTQCYKGIGACFAIDYTLDKPMVVNTLQTDCARQIQNAIVRYQEAGYIGKGQLPYGTVFGDRTHIDTSGKVCIPNTKAIFHDTVSGGPISGVAASSRHKTEALSLLNLIAEDEEFRMQLFYGKEGRDYTISNGYYKITKQEDGSSYSLDFLSPLSYFAGLTANESTADFSSPGTENWHLITYDGKTQLETYRAVLDNSIVSYPIVFDYSGFEKELEAMQPVYEKYFSKFSKLTEEEYDQMLLELENAGSKKILEALQQQLDQWLSENPDWQ